MGRWVDSRWIESLLFSAFRVLSDFFRGREGTY